MGGSLVISILMMPFVKKSSPGKTLSVLFNKGTELDKTRFAQHQTLVTTLAKLESVTWLSATDAHPESATALAGDLEILIPMAGLINKEEESGRLSREIAKLSKEAEKAESKLQNPSFVDRAPVDVVDKERAKLNELKSTISKLQTQMERIAAL